MLCPQCGARNPLGQRRCGDCGRPFTRSALAHDMAAQPADVSVYGDAPVDDRNRYDERHDAAPVRRSSTTAQRRRQRGLPCLTILAGLALLAVIALVGLLAFGDLVLKPMVRDAANDSLRAGVRGEMNRQITAQVGDLPEGEVTISDADVNQRIAANGNLGPIDDVSVAFRPGGVDVRLSAYGLSGTYHAVPRVEDGSVVLAGGSLDGALGYAVPTGDLEQAVNQEIAAALSGAGYQVQGLNLEDGAIVLTLARAG